jgi:hypothetical protein
MIERRLEERRSSPEPHGSGPLSVRASLRGKHVLVTGFTGFVGKVLVGMLLERAPEIGRITILARGKKSQPAAARVRHLFERSPGLRNLREIHGEGPGRLPRLAARRGLGRRARPALRDRSARRRSAWARASTA